MPLTGPVSATVPAATGGTGGDLANVNRFQFAR